MAKLAGWVGLCWLLSGSALAEAGSAPGGFDAPPPPPPPVYGGSQGAVPPAAVAPVAPVQTPEALAAGRYQICFQRMVDAGVNDNAFMKKCLGIPLRGQPQPQPANGSVLANRRLRPGEGFNKAEVTAVVQQNLAGLTDCYDNLLAQSRDLGLTPGGIVGALVEVQPSGQAQVLALDPQSLPDLGLLNCFRSRLRAWSFPRRQGGDRSRFFLSFVLLARSPQKGQVTLARGYPQLAPSAASESRPRPK